MLCARSGRRRRYFLGAVILRTACSFYNKLASGADILGVVPEPEFGKAMLIRFASALVQFGLGLVLRIVGVAASWVPRQLS